MITTCNLKKVFIINEAFKPLIEEQIENVRREHFHHEKHELFFQPTLSSKKLKLTIVAEQMELYFFIAILKSILKKLDIEKRAVNKRKKASIRKTLDMVINKNSHIKRIPSRVWYEYENNVFFARIRVNGARITLGYTDVSELQEAIMESLPPMIEILEKKKGKKK
jgi:hypothetical protein